MYAQDEQPSRPSNLCCTILIKQLRDKNLQKISAAECMLNGVKIQNANPISLHFFGSIFAQFFK